MQQENTPKFRIKEVKYGMLVTSNIGNFENIKVNLEVTADIPEGADALECIEELGKTVKEWGRKEYREIKGKKEPRHMPVPMPEKIDNIPVRNLDSEMEEIKAAEQESKNIEVNKEQ